MRWPVPRVVRVFLGALDRRAPALITLSQGCDHRVPLQWLSLALAHEPLRAKASAVVLGHTRAVTFRAGAVLDPPAFGLVRRRVWCLADCVVGASHVVGDTKSLLLGDLRFRAAQSLRQLVDWVVALHHRVLAVFAPEDNLAQVEPRRIPAGFEDIVRITLLVPFPSVVFGRRGALGRCQRCESREWRDDEGQRRRAAVATTTPRPHWASLRPIEPPASALLKRCMLFTACRHRPPRVPQQGEGFASMARCLCRRVAPGDSTTR